jgi:hypothetical protein
MNDETRDPKSDRPRIVIQEGRIWFTRETERRFYFILTVIMLAAGILYQLEWL